MNETEKETKKIAQAIFTVNRHAKTALKPKHLYKIKEIAIKKLLKEKRARKIGLHFAKNPKFSNQYSTLLIQVDDYYFHIPPVKEDFESLEHLGELDDNFRNPKTNMGLNYAKKVIYNYINWKKPQRKRRKRQSAYYTPSSLGKMEWPPTKKFD